MPRFVLLDRDGVINRRVMNGYVTTWAEFVFMPDALEGLRFLAQHGYVGIVISNQAGVGKGLIIPSALEEMTRQFVQEVERYGGRIVGVYYCPHRPEDDCECRKPKPGLLLQAQREHRFAFAETFMIGDSESDVLAARAVGCPPLLVSDHIAQAGGDRLRSSAPVFSSLRLAAQFIVEHDGVAS